MRSAQVAGFAAAPLTKHDMLRAVLPSGSTTIKGFAP
jgi:hypothetical protein